MKVSGSILCSAIAAAYLAAHLPFLAPSLEDIDSINFALGLREFDVARHQPHPPGYPVYTALGRASLALVTAISPTLNRVRAEALALALWSAIASAIALAAAWLLFRALEEAGPLTGRRAVGEGPPRDERGSGRASSWGALLLAVAPLFWITSLRPMSDMPGLAAALGAQALLAAAWRRRQFVVAAALVAGLAAGVRVQTIWLTFPLLGAVILRHRHAGAGWLLTRPIAALVAGIVAWAVPLILAAGGPEQYVRALGTQAGEDFAWVDMLWANPTPRRLAFALYETFVMPWGSIVLATIVGVISAAGAVRALVRAPGTLALMSLAFAPYALFHLLMQETAHVRYALPVLPAVAWLAGQGVAAAGRAAPILGVSLALFAAVTTTPSVLAYAREPHPAFRAIADMTTAAARDKPAALYGHFAVRRALQAEVPAGVMFVEPPPTNEWAGLLDYWRAGGTAPVWFLADPRRTDLALIDPQARVNVRKYRWAAADRPELHGTRPVGVDWYRLQDPGWFAGPGWSLTPELGGVTRLAGNGVDRAPVDAMVRRRPDAMIAIVGARHLGSAADGALAFTLAIDGRVIDRWLLDPKVNLGSLRIVNLPAGSLDGAGAYARLTIGASAVAPNTRTPPAAVRQFDIQPATGLLHAFDEGWHEEEYENASGLRWRWSSGRSVLRVLPPRGVQLRLRGESPLEYFDAAPTVRIFAGTHEIAERHPDADFEWTFTIPDADMRAADGRIVIETAPVYLPGRAEGTSDERQLGLRLFDIDVAPVLP
jgi:hypothetical protein